MCKADLDKLTSYLKKNLDEFKLLSEWFLEINNEMTRCRKLSIKQIAFAFKVIEKKEMLRVEKMKPNYYLFSAE